MQRVLDPGSAAAPLADPSPSAKVHARRIQNPNYGGEYGFEPVVI